MSKLKGPKATILTKAGAPGVPVYAEIEPGEAASFSDEHVDPASFDLDVRSGDTWLRIGGSLLRAGKAVLRQVILDMRRKPLRSTNGSP